MVPLKQNPGQLITIDVMNISGVCATASDKKCFVSIISNKVEPHVDVTNSDSTT